MPRLTIYETVVPGASVRRSRIGEGPKRPGAHRSVCTTVRIWATGLAPEGETGQTGPRSRRRPPLPGASAAAVQLARSQGRCLFGHIVNKPPRKGSSSSGSRSSGRAGCYWCACPRSTPREGARRARPCREPHLEGAHSFASCRSVGRAVALAAEMGSLVCPGGNGAGRACLMLMLVSKHML